MNMQNRDMASWLVWILGIVRPSVSEISFWMVTQLKYLYDPLPYRLTLKGLFHGYALKMSSFRSMQLPIHVCQLIYVIHSAVSSKFATLQKSLSIPAAIVGVQRCELCRCTMFYSAK